MVAADHELILVPGSPNTGTSYFGVFLLFVGVNIIGVPQ